MKRSTKNKMNSAPSLHWSEAGAERVVDLKLYLVDPSAYGRSTSRARAIAPGGNARRRVQRSHSSGQALLIIALMMTVLVLFVGVGVDVGNLMGKRAKLQSAVDASALSAAQLLIDGVVTTTVQTKAYQMLEANGILSATIASKSADINTELRQVRVSAVQHVDTFFMRLIPAWRTVDVSAEATADLNSFAEMNIKPYGQPGVVNELMLQTWGPYSWRQGGDAYSPLYDPAVSDFFVNSEHASQPYGYLFRIDVPPGFESDQLAIQIFDADTWNRQDDMPVPTNTPAPPPPCSPWPCVNPTIAPTNTPNAYDSSYFWCAQSLAGGCTGNDDNFTNPALRLDGYRTPVAWVQAPWTFGRTSVWRVDEYRQYNNDPGNTLSPSFDEYDVNWPTESNFTLWHFDPHISSAFGDPATLSDQSGGAPVRSTYTARYETDMNGNYTDLAWIEPWAPIQLSGGSCAGDCFERESDGSFYFYLYVSSSNGSSENDYDLRVGPADVNHAAGYDCQTISARWSASYNNICYSNEQFYRQNRNLNAPPDWDTGGAQVFAKRSLPINLATGAAFPMLYTQVTEKAAGQTLAIKHFDQDCDNCTTAASHYQMQYCVNAGTVGPTNLCSTGNCEPCSSLLNPLCFGNISTTNTADAYRGPNNRWWCDACPQPEKVTIPVEGTSKYVAFFGSSGQCSSSWLRLEQNLSYSNDTTVWEMPYKRPRLIK